MRRPDAIEQQLLLEPVRNPSQRAPAPFGAGRGQRIQGGILADVVPCMVP